LKIGNVEWYRRRDSNPHCLVPKTSASSRLGYAGMVNPAGLEPATGGVPARAARVGCYSRLGNKVLIPSDILSKGVLRLVAETGLEPASTDYEPVPGGFTTPVYSASNFSNWLRRKDSNLRMTRSRDERRSTWLLRKGIWWTWHDLNVRPRPPQSRALIPLSYRSEDWYGHPLRGVSDPSFLAPNLPAARSSDSDSGNGGDGAIRTLTGFLPAP
jgi:hypothetical protein